MSQCVNSMVTALNAIVFVLILILSCREWRVPVKRENIVQNKSRGGE
jgi:hypothetical protein